MNLKVLPLPSEIPIAFDPDPFWARVFAYTKEQLENSIITNVPIFNRNLWFCSSNISWYEYNGISYSIDIDKFKYQLKMYNHQPLSSNTVNNLKDIFRIENNSYFNEIKRLLKFDEEVKFNLYSDIFKPESVRIKRINNDYKILSS